LGHFAKVAERSWRNATPELMLDTERGTVLRQLLVCTALFLLAVQPASSQSRDLALDGPGIGLIPAIGFGPVLHDAGATALAIEGGLTLQVRITGAWVAEASVDAFGIWGGCEDSQTCDLAGSGIATILYHQLAGENRGLAAGVGIGAGGMDGWGLMPVVAAQWQTGRRWGPRLELRLRFLNADRLLLTPFRFGFRVPIW
jgi:hypothetical protein